MKTLLGALFLAALTVALGNKPASAEITCGNVPYQEPDADNSIWFFDLNRQRCGAGRGSRSGRGWTIIVDGDDAYLNDSFGVGPSGIYTQGFSGCRMTLIDVFDPDTSDGNDIGDYHLHDGSRSFDGELRTVMSEKCDGKFSGVRYDEALGHRYKVRMDFTGLTDGIAYGLFLEIEAWSDRVEDVDGKHWIHQLCAWGGDFGAEPSFAPEAECTPATASLGLDRKAETERLVRQFVHRRADTIVSEEPDLSERILLPGLSNVDLHGHSGSSIQVDFVTTLSGLQAGDDPTAHDQHEGFDVWAKGKFVYSDSTGEIFGLAWTGLDYHLDPDLVVGVMAQTDFVDDDDFSRGVGWLAGPYAVARVTDGLVIDGRIAGGRSRNRINPFGEYTDRFATWRAIARTQATGDFSVGPVTVNPFVRVVYWRERQHGYTDGMGVKISGQTIDLGRVRFGPKVSFTFQLDEDWSVTPHIAAAGLWTFRHTEDERTLRSRGDCGLTVMSPWGVSFRVEGFYDKGVGRSDYEAFGGALKVTVPLS